MKVSRTVRSGGKGGKRCENTAQTLPIAIVDCAGQWDHAGKGTDRYGKGDQPNTGIP